jgi:hypothetical protein
VANAHQPIRAVETLHDALNLGRAQDHREFLGALGTDDIAEVARVSMQDVAVEKQEGTERLILSAGGDVAFDGQVGEKAVDFGRSHLGGMPQLVELDVPHDPVGVRVLRADGVMPHADFVTQLFE